MTYLEDQMSDDRNNKIGWFLAGLGLGSVAAILFAPKSGRETREAIASGVDDGGEHLASLGRNAREHVADWVDSGKRMVTRKIEETGAADTERPATQEGAVTKRS
jgi:gas vesicle protein